MGEGLENIALELQHFNEGWQRLSLREKVISAALFTTLAASPFIAGAYAAKEYFSNKKHEESAVKTSQINPEDYGISFLTERNIYK